FVERTPRAGHREQITVDEGRVGGLELGVDRRPEQRGDPLPGDAGREVGREVEGGERLLEPEAAGRAGRQHVGAEAVRRAKGRPAAPPAAPPGARARGAPRPPAAPRPHRGPFRAPPRPPPLPRPAGRVSLQAGEAVQAGVALLLFALCAFAPLALAFSFAFSL